jgi:TDG/mug DNA glycosylase family protein
MLKKSFDAVVDDQCKFLVLGSMPGEKSLAEQQYYAHPHNLFWPFMEELFGMPRALPYKKRLDHLLQHQVALWDVLQHCEREGSLDSDIRNETANDFAKFFARYPNIEKIGFNGKKASRVFGKRIMGVQNIERVDLPSTSPANAAISRNVKLEKWREFFAQ